MAAASSATATAAVAEGAAQRGGFAASRAERRRLIELRCAQFQRKLGLQADSAANQAEHALALWESVLTRHPDAPEAALWDLWHQLLRSQRQWSASVWGPLTGELEEEEDPLAQVCLYLLLWGELGNLRFCPELGCFLFAAARSFCRGGGRSANAVDVQTGAGAAKVEGKFLNEIVKPIFSAMLGETYEPGDPPQFKFGRAPAPSKASNYDDWNELFWDSSRLKAAMRLKGTSWLLPRLFGAHIDAAEVWRQLPHVDWQATLRGRKSHREVHSLLPLLVGCYRIFLLQSLAFAVTLLWATSEHRWGNNLQKASIGIIAPAWMLLYEVGYQVLTPSLAWSHRLIGIFKTLFFYMSPVATFALVLLVEQGHLPDVSLPSLNLHMQSRWKEAAFAVHATLSSLVLVMALVPQDQNLYRWRFYPTMVRHQLLGAMAFWLVVLGIAYGLNYLVMNFSGEAIRGVWILYDEHFQDSWVENALLVVQIVLLVFPCFLCFMSSIPLLSTLVIALFGTIRGIHRLGGLKLVWIRRGVGLTPVPRNVCSRVLQIPHERPTDLTMMKALKWWNHMSDRELAGFVEVWNTTVLELRSRDLLSCAEQESLSFVSAQAARLGRVPRLLDPRAVLRLHNALPANPEARRRIVTLARSAQMRELPKGTVRQMPSLTVLVPHYCETILFKVDDLFKEGCTTEMMHFLVKYYRQEFVNFAERICEKTGVRFQPSATGSADDRAALPMGASQLAEAERQLLKWTSCRMQTLWRTIEGICNAYSKALLSLAEQQEQGIAPEQARALVREKFQIVVAVQQYAKFADPTHRSYDAHHLAAVEALLQTFGDWISIAYMDEESSSEGKRYFSCLVDATCPTNAETSGHRSRVFGESSAGMRRPRLRIELPGFPILGHGKSDNQNCALIFTRGEVLQMIDANQDAYYESALFLPLALQEMVGSSVKQRGGRRPGILGFREHIFSNIGLLGRLAADSEFTFGTVVQRTMDRPLEARLHYGHPDVMDKLQMLQQGGVSKGTRGLNLSEDIFAGLDLVLRGGWTTYKEYFHVGKGRDMGFMSALSFYAKVSMGNGEQAITRQWLRLGLELPLSRLLGIFYTHVGYYLNQMAMASALQSFAFMTAFFALCQPIDMGFADSAVGVTTSYFAIFYLLFVLASVVPLLFEVCLEEGLRAAVNVAVNQLLSLGPVFSAFQSKLMGHYFQTTLYHGGAQYIPTGRGLATARESFLKLFRTFACSNIHEGFELAFLLLFTSGVYFGWAFYLCVSFTVVSWTTAPFLFNPRQFASPAQAVRDARQWGHWMWRPSGGEEESWVAWVDRQQDVRRHSALSWLFLPSWRLLSAVCTTVLVLNLVPVPPFARTVEWVRALLAFLPPVFHLALCLVLAPLGLCLGEKHAPIPSHVLLALVAVSLTCFEMSAIKWWSASAGAVLLHKYITISYLLEVADTIAAHRPGGCVLKIFHDALKIWSRSVRFMRDLLLGALLSMMCVLLSLVPCLARLHILFLFRTRAQSAAEAMCPNGAVRANSNEVADDGLEDFGEASSSDALLCRLLERFAPKALKQPLEP